MTALVASEMSALIESGKIVNHCKMVKEVADGLLFAIIVGVGNESTRGYIKGDECGIFMDGLLRPLRL